MDSSSGNSLGVYITKLEDYLHGNFPECILIPSKANGKKECDSGGKSPLWCHKGVATSELWRKWNESGKKNCTKGLVMVMRSDMIVIDVDDMEIATQLENDFPDLLHTAAQRTSKGMHFFFKRTPSCNEHNIFDRARCLIDISNPKSFLPIDIKTVCENGTGGVISLYPSPNKTWIRHLFDYNPIDLPNKLLDFLVARYKGNKVKKTVPKNIVTNSDDTGSQSTTVSTFLSVRSATTQDEVKIISNLVKCLSESRADNYDSWMRVGWCLYNISAEMTVATDTFLEDWIEFSKKSSKFKPGDCEQRWNAMEVKENGLNIGSLRMWAKEDDPVTYSQISKDVLDVLINKCFSRTHFDVANVLHELYHHKIVCEAISGNVWYEFNNHRWRKIDAAYKLRNEISRYLHNIFEEKVASLKQKEVAASNEEEAKTWKNKAAKFTDLCNKLKTTGFKDGVIKECAHLFYIPDFKKNMDGAKHLLGMENGVFDLDQGIFRDGLPTDYITFSTKYDFVENDDKEVQEELMAFMYSIMPNAAMADYLLTVCSYALHGNKKWELLWFFVGNGRNGKGVLCSLLNVVFGDYYYEPDISIVTTTKKSSSAASPELAKAKGKRLFIASEPDDADKDSKFRVNKLKQFRGNDTIQVRALYQDTDEIRPQFAMMFQMNDMPQLSKLDEAIEKSLKVVAFPYQFVPEEFIMHPEYQRPVNVSLKSRFDSDIRYRQQFLRILLKYYKNNVQGKNYLVDPPEVVEESKKYMQENNPVGLWLNKEFEFTGQDYNRVANGELLRLFQNSKDENKNMPERKFAKLMSALGFKTKVMNSQRYYVGLKTKVVEWRTEMDEDL